jgi:hypothetical protein
MNRFAAIIALAITLASRVFGLGMDVIVIGLSVW